MKVSLLLLCCIATVLVDNSLALRRIKRAVQATPLQNTSQISQDFVKLQMNTNQDIAEKLDGTDGLARNSNIDEKLNSGLNKNALMGTQIGSNNLETGLKEPNTHLLNILNLKNKKETHSSKIKQSAPNLQQAVSSTKLALVDLPTLSTSIESDVHELKPELCIAENNGNGAELMALDGDMPVESEMPVKDFDSSNVHDGSSRILLHNIKQAKLAKLTNKGSVGSNNNNYKNLLTQARINHSNNINSNRNNFTPSLKNNPNKIVANNNAAYNNNNNNLNNGIRNNFLPNGKNNANSDDANINNPSDNNSSNNNNLGPGSNAGSNMNRGDYMNTGANNNDGVSNNNGGSSNNNNAGNNNAESNRNNNNNNSVENNNIDDNNNLARNNIATSNNNPEYNNNNNNNRNNINDNNNPGVAKNIPEYNSNVANKNQIEYNNVASKSNLPSNDNANYNNNNLGNNKNTIANKNNAGPNVNKANRIVVPNVDMLNPNGNSGGYHSNMKNFATNDSFVSYPVKVIYNNNNNENSAKQNVNNNNNNNNVNGFNSNNDGSNRNFNSNNNINAGNQNDRNYNENHDHLKQQPVKSFAYSNNNNKDMSGSNNNLNNINNNMRTNNVKYVQALKKLDEDIDQKIPMLPQSGAWQGPGGEQLIGPGQQQARPKDKFSPVESVLKFANMLLYKVGLSDNKSYRPPASQVYVNPNPTNGVPGGIADGDDFDSIDYLYNSLDNGPSGTRSAVLSPSSISVPIMPPFVFQSQMTQNDAGLPFNFLENALDSLLANSAAVDDDNEDDFELRCPLHRESSKDIKRNSSALANNPNDLIQVCSCRLYKKKRNP